MSVETELHEALLLASLEVTMFTGSCPMDMHGWDHPNKCGLMCGPYEKTAYRCWATYFRSKVE
ncbi:hypothetical protein LCGC14_0278130 [marine sediment metagenome]|uniref:Uncharacterized protein n=1 Tax=marine sediment metagenome TaxID=412755 RepID=A0A0F9TWT3_9ZZZZ